MIIALIPARLKSSRLKDKPLIKLNGIPLVVRVAKRLKKCKKLNRIIVCADDNKIAKICRSSGIETYLTSKNHKNGTERINEISKKIKSKLIIDVQCDAAFVSAKEIDNLIEFHKKNNQFDIIIPHSKYHGENDKSAVKLVTFKNKIIYMSRSDIPYSYMSKLNYFKRHQDFISFKPKALSKFCKSKSTPLEKIEGVELLRALELKMQLGTYLIKKNYGVESINTRSDLNKAVKILKN
tara:strand:+ start:274 stop:987 length:714 start_codon:yes stop_codon:yes gene_type:complete